MKIRHQLVMFLSLVLCFSAQAQKRSMTLEELFQLADTNNKALKANIIETHSAQEGLLSAKSNACPTSRPRCQPPTSAKG